MQTISSRDSRNLIYILYSDKRTVFTIQEIAMLVGEPDFMKLKWRVNYHVRNNKLNNPRKGIYTKKEFSREELACKIFRPAYVSLEYVLQKAGYIFQYSTMVTSVSYLSREIFIDGKQYKYRKIKVPILYNTNGIIMNDNGVSIASKERAFLDIMYLNKTFYFDNLKGIDKNNIMALLPLYNSNQLYVKVKKILNA
jgi:hypothetical protein